MRQKGEKDLKILIQSFAALKDAKGQMTLFF